MSVVPDEDLNSAARYEWERIVRRVQMPASTKLVALALATYANRDGSSLYPGVVRLAAVTCLSEKTVRVGLAWLRDAGLLERTRKGSHLGRKALADEHRLTIPTDLLDRCDLLSPDEAPVTTTGDKPKKVKDHRYSVPRSPVTVAGSPVTASPITGTGYRTPTHDHPGNQHTNQRDDQDSDVTTEGARTGTDNVVALRGWGGRR